MGERRTPGGPFGMVRALKAAFAQKRSQADDTGAALILALVFLIVAALTLTALVTFAGTGLLDGAGFTSQRGLQYGASGAVEVAIQRVRYTPYTSRYYQTLQNCLGTTSTTSIQLTEFQVRARYEVYCQGAMVSLAPTFSPPTATVGPTGKMVKTTVLFTTDNTSFEGYGFSVVGTSTVTTIVTETPSAHTVRLKTSVQSGTKTVELLPPYQRLVTFYACRVATPSGPPVAHPCRLTPTTVTKMTPTSVLVKAVVGFGDLVSTGTDQCKKNSTPPTPACGTSYVVTQWTVSSANH